MSDDEMDTDDLRKEIEKLLRAAKSEAKACAEAAEDAEKSIEVSKAGILEIFGRMEKEINSLRASMTRVESDLSERDDDESGVEEAINDFLDVVDRPVGKLTFTLPPTDEANRMVLGLYDAINRSL